MSVAIPEKLNLAEHFLARRLELGDGDRIALRLDHVELSYAQVDALAQDWGRALAARGVRREERVLLALPDGEGLMFTDDANGRVYRVTYEG